MRKSKKEERPQSPKKASPKHVSIDFQKKRESRSKKILMAASEVVPFAKTGGLADVATALPKALRKLGHDARIIMPRYWGIDREKYGLKKILSPMGVRMGDGNTVWCEVWEGRVDGVPVYFVEHEGFFGRSGIYDDGKREYDDNAARFGFFSRAVFQFCQDFKFQPDIIHANDWPTSLIPVYLKTWELNNPFFAKTASVLTIHNISYQGVFPGHFYSYLGLGWNNFTEPRLESHGRVHFLKGGIFFADAITTVSPSHAEEILTPDGGKGLAPYLERRRADFCGILNGVDYDLWNPERDTMIPANYSTRGMSGKAVCKAALQREFLLEENPKIPVIGIVSRFVHQKGFDMLAEVIEKVAKNMVVQFAILGSGEKWMEDYYGGLPARYPGRIGAWIGYNNQKAHLIEAGSDFFLMPSLFEPCGLNQIYSLRYGTLPIVREIGGLKDTVEQYNEKEGTGTGFRFVDPNTAGVYFTIGWAVSTYYDRPKHFEAMRQQAMKTQFCWFDAAKKYEAVYDLALARRAAWR